MALGNLMREPRRELTESAVGLLIFGAVIAADYAFGMWLQSYAGLDHNSRAEIPWPIGMMIGVIVAGLGFATLILTHALGEAICDKLQDNGIRLRPQRRY